jgi:uncharacterized protein YdeI (YjbR/CyaY-like superfamily)
MASKPQLDRAPKSPEEHKGLPILLFRNVATYRTWLSKNHKTSSGIWIRLAKKGTETPSLTYEEARDHAIAFGWIDGLKNALDDEFYAIRLVPDQLQSR